MRVIIQTFLAKLFTDARGATAIEYGLILCLIALATISALRGIADPTNGFLATVEAKSEDALARSGIR
ncbi:MAG TPA: Flp family type IVb pilin [Novosphingobium sp.]